LSYAPTADSNVGTNNNYIIRFALLLCVAGLDLCYSLGAMIAGWSRRGGQVGGGHGGGPCGVMPAPQKANPPQGNEAPPN